MNNNFLVQFFHDESVEVSLIIKDVSTEVIALSKAILMLSSKTGITSWIKSPKRSVFITAIDDLELSKYENENEDLEEMEDYGLNEDEYEEGTEDGE